MKVGIVGFAGSGKTTVFNALTGLSADTGFGSKEKANLGMIKVPDERIRFLTEIYTPKKTTFAEIAFVDVAGPAEGSQSGGLEQSIVQHMREAEALVHVVGAFDNPASMRDPDPEGDIGAFDGEMILTDLVQIDNRIQRLDKEGRKNVREWELMNKLHAHLEADRPLRTIQLDEAERQALSGYSFLSLKPCMVLLNVADDQAAAPIPETLAAAAKERGMEIVAMTAEAEAEIAQLDADDQQAFLQDLGLPEPARDRFIKAVYGQLDLISFLTSGPDECRAWTIRRGTNARTAAGKIHSDIERGFIRAEVIAYDDFHAFPSEAQCRDKGKLRLEGKEYVVADGDIIHFRFNV